MFFSPVRFLSGYFYTFSFPYSFISSFLFNPFLSCSFPSHFSPSSSSLIILLEMTSISLSIPFLSLQSLSFLLLLFSVLWHSFFFFFLFFFLPDSFSSCSFFLPLDSLDIVFLVLYSSLFSFNFLFLFMSNSFPSGFYSFLLQVPYLYSPVFTSQVKCHVK